MAEKKKKPYEIGELDQYLFGQGNHYEIYEKLGAHLVQNGKQKGVYFAVWAPHAQAVSCLLYTSPSPRDRTRSRMPSSACK